MLTVNGSVYKVRKYKKERSYVVVGGSKGEELNEENPNTGAPAMNMGGVVILLGIACVAFKKH